MDNKMNSNGKQAEGRNDPRNFRRFIEESFPVKDSITHHASRIQINLDAKNNGG